MGSFVSGAGAGLLWGKGKVEKTKASGPQGGGGIHQFVATKWIELRLSIHRDFYL